MPCPSRWCEYSQTHHGNLRARIEPLSTRRRRSSPVPVALAESHCSRCGGTRALHCRWRPRCSCANPECGEHNLNCIAAVMMMIILDSLQFAHWHASANCDERCSRRAEACRRLLDGRGGRGLLATTVTATTKSSCAVLLDDRYRTVRRRAACVYRRACIWRGGGQWGARPSGCRARLQLQARGLRAVRDCSCSCAACLLL
jgi:hypothetical protein